MQTRPVAFHFFFAAMFLMWAWGAADAAHVLRHQEGKSLLRLLCAAFMLVVGILAMLDMLAMAFFFGVW
jgi:hypothetical protein